MLEINQLLIVGLLIIPQQTAVFALSGRVHRNLCGAGVVVELHLGIAVFIQFYVWVPVKRAAIVGRLRVGFALRIVGIVKLSAGGKSGQYEAPVAVDGTPAFVGQTALYYIGFGQVGAVIASAAFKSGCVVAVEYIFVCVGRQHIPSSVPVAHVAHVAFVVRAQLFAQVYRVWISTQSLYASSNI